MTPQPFEELREAWKKHVNLRQRFYDYTSESDEAKQIFEFFSSHLHQKLLSLKERMEKEAFILQHHGAVDLDVGALIKLDTAISLLGITEEKK